MRITPVVRRVNGGAATNPAIPRANVIDVTNLSNDGKIIFGCTVNLENLDTHEKLEYKIVGKDEADLKKKLGGGVVNHIF